MSVPPGPRPAPLAALAVGHAVELPPAGVLTGTARTDLPEVAVTRLRGPGDAVGFGGGRP